MILLNVVITKVKFKKLYLYHNFFHKLKNYIICLDVPIPPLEPNNIISVIQNYNNESSNYEQGVNNMIDTDIVINENYNILSSTSDQSKI